MYFCSGLSTRTLHAAGAALHQSLASNCRSCSVGSPGKRKRAIQRACKFAFSSMNSMPATEERIVVGPDIGGGILGPRSREQTETNAKGRRRRKRALRKSVDGGEKWASTAIGSTRSRTAAPKAARVAPDGRRARRVRRTAMPVNGGGRSFLVKSYDLRSRNLGRTAPLVAHQQGYYNAR